MAYVDGYSTGYSDGGGTPAPPVVEASSGASAADLGMKHPRSSGAARRRIVDPFDIRRKYRTQY